MVKDYGITKLRAGPTRHLIGEAGRYLTSAHYGPVRPLEGALVNFAIFPRCHNFDEFG